MSMHSTISAEHAEITPADHFTYAESTEYRQQLFAALDASISRLDIDLHNITFMDSAGLGMLLVTEKECAQRNVALTLRKPQAEVKSLLELTNSAKRFTITE
jgi:anti-anti-sigma factor